MAAFADHQYRMVVIMCGAQMGKTESLLNILGHRFTDGPYVPALVIGPTEKNIRSLSKDRFQKMINTTELLKLREDRKMSTTMERFFAGVRCGFGWAGSPTELASHPAGLVLVDEVDRMVTDVGGEGDPVSLAAARTKNYSNSKIGIVSTPTVEGASAIHSHYLGGTMGRWAWPCPECAEYFIPEFKLLHWPRDDAGNSNAAIAEKGAFLACPNCGGEIANRHKERMNREGRYLFHVDNDGSAECVGFEPPANSVASFWISGLASPWVTFGEMAGKWIKADQANDNGRRQTILNTEFGELWTMGGERPEAGEVARLIEDYEPGTAPVGVQLITCGVDVQQDGLFFIVVGWGANSESWTLQNGFIGGDTAYDDVWLRLTRVREQLYGDQRITATFIDSGFRPGDSGVVSDHQVYKYCRQFSSNTFAVKGRDIMDTPYKQVRIDVTLAGRTIKNGLRLFHVNSHYFKDFVYTRIRWPEELLDQPGRMHLHRETNDDFCKQMVSEELVVKASGRFLWIRKHANHYLDCFVYATCAASHLGVATLVPLSQKPAPKPDKPEKQRFITAPRGKFIR